MTILSKRVTTPYYFDDCNFTDFVCRVRFIFILRTLSCYNVCSGRPLTAESKGKLNNQIIDASWVCPGQSETPSIESILAQCRSIKSWLDIRHDNIAFVHCSNGRTRSGVLVACLLKYIGAFDRACDAFDFFCRTRYTALNLPNL